MAWAKFEPVLGGWDCVQPAQQSGTPGACRPDKHLRLGVNGWCTSGYWLGVAADIIDRTSLRSAGETCDSAPSIADALTSSSACTTSSIERTPRWISSSKTASRTASASRPASGPINSPPTWRLEWSCPPGATGKRQWRPHWACRGSQGGLKCRMLPSENWGDLQKCTPLSLAARGRDTA